MALLVNGLNNSVIKQDLKNAKSIMIGGIGEACGRPIDLISLIEDNIENKVDIITCDIVGVEVFINLLKRGLVNSLITSYIGVNEAKILDSLLNRDWKLELVPQGNFMERIHAGAYGTGPVYLPVGPGTDYVRQKEVREFKGVSYVLEYPLIADISLVRAYKADIHGNLKYHKTMQTTNHIMAMAGEITIVEVDEVVSLTEFEPENIHTSGLWVNIIHSRR